MRYTVVFDADARADLAELYEYLLPEAGERIARDYVDRLIDRCATFETFPERGTKTSVLASARWDIATKQLSPSGSRTKP
jgi:plasmid stabilization system protein ParE